MSSLNMKKISAAVICIFVAISAVLFVAASLNKDIVGIPEGMSGRYMDVLGVKIRVEQVGSGQDVLFIHGLPGCIEDWEVVKDSLIASGKNYRMTFYDRPGHGYSGYENIGYNIDHNTDVALNLIEQLNLKDVIVVGHSYGGAIALSMATRRPGRVKAYIALSAASHHFDKADFVYRMAKWPVVGKGLTAAGAGLIGPTILKNDVRRAYYPNIDTMPDDFISSRKEIWLTPKVSTTIAYEKINMSADQKKMQQNYGNIDQPLFIMHGKDDRIVDVEESQKLHQAIKHSKLHIVIHTGHQIQYARDKAIVLWIERAAMLTASEK